MSSYLVEIPLAPTLATGHALQWAELLRTANLVAQLRLGQAAPHFCWRWVDMDGHPMALPVGWALPTSSAPPEADQPAQAMFLSHFACGDIPALRRAADELIGLRRRVGIALDRGCLLGTLGSGAWLAARSTPLLGHRLALPWYYLAGFHHDFPQLRPMPGENICEDRQWLSAALPRDLSDLATRWVRRLWGDELADAMAAVVLPDPARAQAAMQAAQADHIPATRNSTLARALQWMNQHLDQTYDLNALASAVAVSPRTLLRHFQLELGHSPLDHLHRLRCDRAKVLLEITLESIPSIAQACGYADPAAFRRIFVRHTRETPAAYRQKHRLRAPRRRWGVDTSGAD
jgi:transcriptional regulator GlxA family with amidase domain